MFTIRFTIVPFLGEDANVGPYAIVHAGAKIGKNVHIGAHSIVHPWAVLGDDVILESHCVVGGGAVISAGESEEVPGDLEGRVEDDVPDGCVWMEGRVAMETSGRSWDLGGGNSICGLLYHHYSDPTAHVP